MQCMAGAMSAGAGATGLRSYLAAHGARWLTPKRMKAITVTLVAGALGASSLIVTGPNPASAQAHHTPAAHTASR